MTRLLGVDLGERRIGLAVADTATGVVRPLTTIRRREAEVDAATLSTIREEQGIEELVVGLPLNMSGTEGGQAKRTREWVDSIAPLLDAPISWRDERLTSERAEASVSRGRRGRSGGPPSAAARNQRRARVDQVAAVNILQAELDARAAAEGATAAAEAD